MTNRRLAGLGVALSLAVRVAALPASVMAEDYKLGVSDRIKITVQEWPDLDGEYTVAPDGVVSLPLIGGISALGLRPNDLGNEISDRMQRSSNGKEHFFTAVEITKYRPFSILGDVQRPGEYPYRPGLTVVEAIGIAGGYYRPELGLLRLSRDAALASGDIHTETAKLNRLIFREARLNAALAGRQDIALPPELAKQKEDPDVVAIMQNEQDALALENEIRRSEQATADNIKSLYQKEIESLQGHVQALTQEQDSISAQLKEMRAMAARGLALAPTMFALERSLAQVASQQMSTETAIVRAEENITLAQQHVTDAEQQGRRTETKDLETTRDEITEARAKIVTATDLLREAQIIAPAEVRAGMSRSDGGGRQSFTILRRDGVTMREIVVDETALVAPGDVIKIPTLRLPTAQSGSINVSSAEPPMR